MRKVFYRSMLVLAAIALAAALGWLMVESGFLLWVSDGSAELFGRGAPFVPWILLIIMWIFIVRVMRHRRG